MSLGPKNRGSCPPATPSPTHCPPTMATTKDSEAASRSRRAGPDERATRQGVGYRLLALLVVSATRETTALTTTPVPYGTIILPSGIARSYTSAVDVVVVRPHPRVARKQAWRHLEDDLTYFLSKLAQWEDSKTIAETYSARKRALQHARLYVQEETVKTPSRHRRAPLGFIGALSKSIFGTATTKDVEKVRDKVNGLISALQDRDLAIQRNAIALDESAAYTAQVAKAVQQLQDGAVKIRDRLDAITSVVDSSWPTAMRQALQMTESILSLLEFYTSQASIYDMQYLHQRDWAEAGHLTESLVSRASLMKCLKSLRSQLPPEYIYAHTPVHLLRVTDDRMAYIFRLPNITGATYNAWHIETAPFLYEGRLVRLQPKVVDIALAVHDGAMIDTAERLYQEPMLCHNPVERQTLPCVNSLLTHEADLRKNCLINPITGETPLVKRITNGFAAWAALAGTTAILLVGGMLLAERKYKCIQTCRRRRQRPIAYIAPTTIQATAPPQEQSTPEQVALVDVTKDNDKDAADDAKRTYPVLLTTNFMK